MRELPGHAYLNMSTTDLTGSEIGHWRVMSRAPNRYRGQPYWLCQCVCGKQREVNGQRLTDGNTKSCGCRRRPSQLTHGRAKTREHRTWCAIIYRCGNPACPTYKYYGARGISVCAEWRNSFERFYADMGPCPANHSLERKNNSKGYEPENCCWATRKQQARNTRRNAVLTWNGESLPIVAWADRTGISQKTIGTRIRDGWTVGDALSKPVRGMRI